MRKTQPRTLPKIKSEPAPKTTPDHDRALSRAEAAAMCGVSPDYLANMAVFGEGPPFRKVKPGKRGKVIYIRSEVLAWRDSLPTRSKKGR
jgi:hypothetical protein